MTKYKHLEINTFKSTVHLYSAVHLTPGLTIVVCTSTVYYAKPLPIKFVYYFLLKLHSISSRSSLENPLQATLECITAYRVRPQFQNHLVKSQVTF